MVLEKLERFGLKEIKTVNPKGKQSILKEIGVKFIGKTVTEASVLWPPDAKSRLIGKDPDAGED